ncbi:anthranilate synthase component I family protein [Paenibacillus macquariensis]|uniref:anthranilate synthase component I family protein n=1 Tax=Paenibacillus macquariensis TaxID=948756 RepID=UPI002DB80B7C|nr:anthranilate synthase component I family protein [Paenibacillus macquariensis]MEC0094109.1 anthranilate synthase component I family protein [Paenibacillus macquariensis]
MTTNVLTSLAQWEQWATNGWSVLPYLVRMEGKGLPLAWTRAWEASSPYAVVLESGKSGRYTYLGLNPTSVISGKGNEASLRNPRTGETEIVKGAPLEVLEQWMAPYRTPQMDKEDYPPFLGGCVGFMGYDVVRSLERLPSWAEDEPAFPDYMWMRMEEIWIYDNKDQVVYCAVHMPLNNVDPSLAEGTLPLNGGIDFTLEALFKEAQDRVVGMMTLWASFSEVGPDGVPVGEAEKNHRLNQLDKLEEQERIPQGSNSPNETWPGMTAHFSQESFEKAVVRIQEYIRQGDVFQVNLSLRQEKELHSSPEQIYEWLRLLNPSPYMGLLRSPGFSLVSGSPELLVKVHGDKVSARPIAGTRRRGITTEEDAVMAEELYMNEKERAEHIMLVDLERNDIGRIAAYGSVHVPELMTIEYYSHVMHLVSQIEGSLASGKDVYEVIAALFPGGTITGAPKIRTMEIIEELEPVRRGPYTGSMGWIDYNGNMELNIIIRTLVVQDGKGYIQAGAGIVVDSDPYREYRECHNKAKAMIKAVLCSEEETAVSR